VLFDFIPCCFGCLYIITYYHADSIEMAPQIVNSPKSYVPALECAITAENLEGV
jgi:hypothetical protein